MGRATRPIVLGVLLGLGGPACTDRAYAQPACTERPVVATDLRVDLRPREGEHIELQASAAALEPGFPEPLAGTFENARFSVAPPPPVASAPAQAKEGTAAATADAESFSVHARRMRYDSRGGRASFSGDVQVAIGELSLSCDSLEVTYHRGAEGSVDFLASGSIRVERPGLVATSGKAQYEGASGALTLTESPRVEGDVGVLEGTRIVLDVDDETVTVDDVRGTFRVRQP